MAIEPKIFKKYDIRGKAVGEDASVNPDTAQAIGRAFATYLQATEGIRLIVVGRDNRLSSEALQHTLIQGLTSGGCSVIDLGLVATPVVYWHAINRGNVGGIMVTGSHLGPEQNGFKLCVGNRTLYGEEIQALRQLIDEDKLIKGVGSVTKPHDVHSKYIADLTARIPAAANPLKVVIDAGNGVGGIFGPQLIRAWGHEVVAELYCDLDGNFPNHPANPQEPENMVELGKLVEELGADIGIAFDGDADRMGAVNQFGELVAADRLLALLAQDMLSRHPDAAVVADVLTSQVLFDVVTAAGGRPFMAPSGHSLVKEFMRSKDAMLGGEMSGHIFLGEDFFGHDDGFFAAGRLLQLLSASGETLGYMDDKLPRLYSTPEYRPHCPDDDKQAVIDGVTNQLRDKGEVETVDGLRVKFEKGWGLLRASNTEPVLSLRFEGETEADALAYRDLFVEALKKYPQVESII